MLKIQQIVQKLSSCFLSLILHDLQFQNASFVDSKRLSKAALPLLFHLFYAQCCSILNVLILTILCVQLFNSVKVTELPPVWVRAANSAYHLFSYFVVC